MYRIAMREYTVRVGTPSDAAGLAPILAELLKRPRLDEGVLAALNTNVLRLLQTPGATFLVAVAPDQSLLGFTSLHVRWGLLDQSPSGLIDRVVVRPSVADSSVASALLEQALGACQGMGCSSIDLVLTLESTVDKAVLEGFGFTELGKRFHLEVL